MKVEDKLLIFDGNSLINRAFYALPPLATAQGIQTNAVYGFISMLLRLLEEEKPNYVAIAFDHAAPTFRHVEYQDYKGHRTKAPDQLIEQFPLIKRILQVMKIQIIEKPGYEADDLIGTIARQAEAKAIKTLIVTGDRDAFQLVSPYIHVLFTKKGITELEVIDEQKVVEKYSLKPAQIIDLKGLMGDKSDNIPGLPGVGEKTALELIHQYGSVEGVIKHVNQISRKKLAETIEKYKDLAILSKRLATIKTDVPLELTLTDFRKTTYDFEQVRALFAELEFHSLIKRIQKQQEKEPLTISNGEIELSPVNLLDSVEKKTAFFEKARSNKRLAMRLVATNDQVSQTHGIAFATSGVTAYLPFVSHLPGELIKILTDKTIMKIAWDSKAVYKYLHKLGIKDVTINFDPLIAAYLLEPSQTSYSAVYLANRYLAKQFAIEQTTQKGKENLMDSLIRRGQMEAGLAEELTDQLVKLLTEQELLELLNTIEMPLANILALMENYGVLIDLPRLKELVIEMNKAMAVIEQEIYALAGETFNINSTKQLGKILFDKLNLPIVKKTKNGYSTDAGVLEKLAPKAKIAARILDYRQIAKLKSTYAEGLLKLVNPHTGRIHTTYNQTITTTGRLSSTEPNLQNIPVRTEMGRNIRSIFIAPPGHVLVAADYSQIELRVLAHISKDPVLIEAFLKNEDIHARTAAEVFNVPITSISPEMRRRAKTINFGIIYGLSDFGLAQDLKISRKEAKEYIQNYFARYAGVKKYIEQTISRAREQGYVTTLFNRRRYLPDLNNRNANIRAFAERTAVNTPIQGSAADIIKIAMVNIQQRLNEQGLASKMLLQVHDELVFEVPNEELEQLVQLIREEMEGAVELVVPLIVDIKSGPNWNNMVKYKED